MSKTQRRDAMVLSSSSSSHDLNMIPHLAPSSDLPPSQKEEEKLDPSSSSTRGEGGLTRSTSHDEASDGNDNGQKMTRSFEKIRLRRRTADDTEPGEYPTCIPPMAFSIAPLPLAAYQPASLVAVLLVASLLPKNTFSLRWLALSGMGMGVMTGAQGGAAALGRSGMGRYCVVKSNLEWKLFAERNDNETMHLPLVVKATPLGPPTEERRRSFLCDDAAERIGETGQHVFDSWDRMAMWTDLNVSPLEVTSSARQPLRLGDNDDDECWDWSVMDSILGTIPRGGGDHRHDGEDEGKMYSGLVNMGNTCYLNAQLQCAYHIPFLRQLVLDARDEVREVEVEVDIDDENKGELSQKERPGINMAVDNNIPEMENDLVSSKGDVSNDYAGLLLPVGAKMKTLVRKVVKKEVVPLSQALRALKVTFESLGNCVSSSGSTNFLCRTLGIDPNVQQDGQEFWKLFIPEIKYDRLAKLYSGQYDDYVREILPESRMSMDEELDMGAEEYFEEEKKEEVMFVSSKTEVENLKAQERVSSVMFSDLSIPVAEGTGGSVEYALREMFTEPEILRVSEGNGWRPSKGAKKVDAYKGFTLNRQGLPAILQLHLKRFKYDYETGETSKINDRCTFPFELDLSELTDHNRDEEEGDAIYDLQSIVIHKGEYGSGHYYSYVRPDIQTDKWYRFDDEYVTRVDCTDVIADAYGGCNAPQRNQSRSDSFASYDTHEIQQRKGLLRRILSLFGLFRRLQMIRSRAPDRRGGFGYGGRMGNAYMLQYVHRSDIPKLWCLR